MPSKSVRLAAGQRVRLPSGLSPFVSLLVGHCVRLVSLLSTFALLVSLLVGHCVRLVSLCLLLPPFLSPVLSPFLLVTVSTLSPFCLHLSPFLSPFLLVTVSALSPCCLPFLVGHCVRLVSLLSTFALLVSLLVGHCVRLVSLLSPFVSLLVSGLVSFVGHCVHLVSLLSPFSPSNLLLGVLTAF